MAPAMADDFMAKLKAGSTVRKLTSGVKKFGPAIVSFERFKKHCELHPEWGVEAWRVSKINRNKGRGSRFRNLTHCKHGHPLIEARVRYYKGWTVRDCLRCEAERRGGGIINPAVLLKVKAALKDGGATINQVIHGRPVGGGSYNPSLRLVDSAAFYRHRRENPDFDRFVAEASANNNSRGQQIRHARERARVQTAKRLEDANDYHKILALFPVTFPGRDDAAHDVFVAILDGSLKREDAPSRVRHFIGRHNRMFPPKYAKFGSSPLVSLDQVLFEDGMTTRGDTVSRGLWD
jgi:hypothetical protein